MEIAISLPVILQIAQFVVLLFGGGVVAFKIGKATSRMEMIASRQSEELSELKKEITKLGEILTRLALADQRMNMMQKQIEELRHGEGMVFPLTKSAFEHS